MFSADVTTDKSAVIFLASLSCTADTTDVSFRLFSPGFYRADGAIEAGKKLPMVDVGAAFYPNMVGWSTVIIRVLRKLLQEIFRFENISFYL